MAELPRTSAERALVQIPEPPSRQNQHRRSFEMTTTTGPKKRKRDVIVHQSERDVDTDTSRPTAVFTPDKPRRHTLSVALPGSVIANALTHEHKTALTGQIGRALAVFCVDEVIIFNDGQNHNYKGGQDHRKQDFVNKDEHTGWTDPDHFLYHLLSYLETPPFLRKSLFPIHPNLRTAGTLPSLDMPHHLRSDEQCQYREGVTLANSESATDRLNDRNEETPKAKRARRSEGTGTASFPGSPNFTWVDIGTPQKVKVPVAIPPNTRVTLEFPSTVSHSKARSTSQSELTAKPVHPSAPREVAGYYWGYAVRQSPSLSAIFTECPHDGGYDLSIGTSERGESVAQTLYDDRNQLPSNDHPNQDNGSRRLPTNWNHLLVVFGGPAGIEAAVAADKELRAARVEDAKDVFDAWVNVCSGQGSRTIRTEEAIWVGLTSLRDFVRRRD